MTQCAMPIAGVVIGVVAATCTQGGQAVGASASFCGWGGSSACAGRGFSGSFPGIDAVSSWIDQRTITTSFAAEQTLTSDTVPVNVDAVLFWMVYDAEKAALEVQDYKLAVSWAAQTALRDIIGRTPLDDSAPRP